MATFKIHHDEKENNNAHGNKMLNIGKNGNFGNNKDKRPTLALLSNVSNQPRVNQGGKTAFADIKLSGNIASQPLQQQQQNVFKQKQQSNIIFSEHFSKNTSVIGGLSLQNNKKTTVTNTVINNNTNQFSNSTSITTVNSTKSSTISTASNDHASKIFTVYEDNSFEYAAAAAATAVKENKIVDVKNKENVESANKSLTGAIRDPLKEITSKYEAGSETPMSVSDILSSPMSVDKTSISQIDVCGDDSVSAAYDEKIKLLKKPKNDRERFYEIEEYQEDILAYFREAEKRCRPKAGYMKRQPDINYSMRTILVDWLVEVAEEYKLDTETLFLAISYIDRFLSCMSVVRGKLQLLGTAAMFVAAKYEEIYPPDVSEFVFITDDTYTKSQVLRMEQILLKILGFDLSGPTCYVYLNTYGVLYSMTDKVKVFATYLCELALLEGDPYLKFLPSQISSAAVALARYALDLPMWDCELIHITSYDLIDLKEVILNLSRSHNASGTLQQQAVQEKYKLPKYLEVSRIEPVDINETNIDEILIEQIELMKELETSSAANNSNICSTNSNNESVRQMISSLIF